MLIQCHRHTQADLAAWAVLQSADLRYARENRARLKSLERRAHQVIRRWLSQRDGGYVSSSWGKDSVVVCALVRDVDPRVPVVHGAFRTGWEWATSQGEPYTSRENPHCADVAEAYLSAYPSQSVDVECGGRAVWWRPIEQEFGPDRVTGIRAAESGIRTLSAAVHGVSTRHVCRPILYWSTQDVFAYLAVRGLPVHPSYAMSIGGSLDRDALRVDVIGGDEGANRGRREWERIYYRDVIDAPPMRSRHDKSKAERAPA